MNAQAKIAAVQQMIAAEAQALAQFVDLLKLEQSALSSGDTDALPAYAEQKIQFGVQLNSLATQRNAALAAQGFSSDRSGVEAWCARHPDQGNAAATWSRLLSQAAEARQLNLLNGNLIQTRMRFNANALEVLRGGNSSLDLYGPDGQSRSASHRRINDSV